MQPVEFNAVVHETYFHTYSSEFPDNWFVLAKDIRIDGGKALSLGKIFLRPEQHSRINDLWCDQKIKLRGFQITGRLAKLNEQCFLACEIISCSPGTKCRTVSADEVLQEFRKDYTAASERFRDDWSRITGIVDEVLPEGLVMRGTEKDGRFPNRIEFQAGSFDQRILKDYKPGQQLTLRGRSPMRHELAKSKVIFQGVYWAK